MAHSNYYEIPLVKTNNLAIIVFSRHIGASRGQHLNLAAELLDHYCVGGSNKGLFKKKQKTTDLYFSAAA